MAFTFSSTAFQHELTVATKAALKAGAMFRDEFNRTGAPGGRGDHADIDEVAETEIARRLQMAFPQDGYLGEECREFHCAGTSGRVILEQPPISQAIGGGIC